MVWRIQGCACVCAVAELAQLPHPIKYACSVWAVCFFYSGEGWALWIIRSKQEHEFWRTRVTPACTRAPRSGVIHQSQRSWCLKAPDETQTHLQASTYTHTQTHLCSCTPACTHYPPTPAKLETTRAGGDILFFAKWLTLNTWLILHLWYPVCLFFGRHSVPSATTPPPRCLCRGLIKTTFTRPLSSHDCSLSMFSL